MRARHTIALGLWLAAVVPGHGQDPQASPSSEGSLDQQGRGHWRTYGVTDGLGALDVWDIFRDRDGTMWFATEGGGVSRYDGDAWTVFSSENGLVDNAVYAIVQDAAGDLWFRSRQGVSRYDGATWTAYTEADGLIASSGYYWPIVLVSDRDGNVWYGSDLGGVSRFDGSRWTSFDTVGDQRFGDVWGATQDRDGAMWFATDAGVVRHQDGDWRTYDVKDGLAGSHVRGVASDGSGALWFATTTGLSRLEQGTWTTFLPDLETADVLCASDGDVWVSTPTGLHRFDGKDWQSFASAGLPFSFYPRIVEDSRGDIWLGSRGGGVWRYDGARLHSFGVDDGLPNLNVAPVAEDPEGRLWFGTPGGVSRYDGTEWLTLSTRDALPHDTVRDVFEDRDGNIWLATDAGVSRHDGISWQHFTTADGLPDGSAWSLAQDRSGRLWMTSGSRKTPESSGVASFDGATWRIEGADASATRSDRVYDTFEDSSGRLWWATHSGVHRLVGDPGPGASWETFDTTDGLGDNYACCITQDLAGDIWVGTGTGASRYDGQVWRHYTPADGLPRGVVRAILADAEGRVWFGSDGYGVGLYDGETFRILTTADGLAHNSLRSIMQDRHGDIWFGTDAGLVSRYDGEVFQTLTAEDGLTGQSVRSIMQDRRGDIWFGTYGGLVRFRQPADRPPGVTLDAVIADRRHANPRAISVPSTVKLVVFEFHGSSFRTRLDGMVYRYRLRGHDADWQTTRTRRVEYTDLPTGDYVFEIFAVDRDLVRSEAPAVVVLQIHAPYERIAWVSALLVALGLVLVQGTRIVRRDRRLVEANRQIEQTTRNKSEFLRRMSHDLRSPMNAIIGYTRLVLRRSRDVLDERQVRNLENIETSSNNLLNLINDILDLSRIEAGRIEVSRQPVDVRELAGECADALASIVKPGVELRRQLTDVGRVDTDPDRLRQVVMNLLGNATKFTESGLITLSLKKAGDVVELSVADTGIGIPADDLPHIFDEFRQVERQGGEAAEGTGLGLAIAKKTVDLLGGEISATSEVGVGTTFIVRLPG